MPRRSGAMASAGWWTCARSARANCSLTSPTLSHSTTEKDVYDGKSSAKWPWEARIKRRLLSPSAHCWTNLDTDISTSMTILRNAFKVIELAERERPSLLRSSLWKTAKKRLLRDAVNLETEYEEGDTIGAREG